jgi:transcriptional regulator of acetoin/glycerol metabolism
MRSARSEDWDRDRRRCATPLSPVEQCDLEIDLAQATTLLEPAQQYLCDLLKRMPVPDAAAETGVARGTVYRRLRPIRRVFDSAGLAKYLE